MCAVQECGTPLEREGKNCTALPPHPGQCCPEKYQCGKYFFDNFNNHISIQASTVSTDITSFTRFTCTEIVIKILCHIDIQHIFGKFVRNQIIGISCRNMYKKLLKYSQ